MRNILQYVFLLPVFLSLNAQNDYSTNAEVELVLNPVNTIQVNHESVNLPMNQTTHFINGNVSEIQHNHVQVFSTSAYIVNVKTDQGFFSLEGAETGLSVENVQVEVSMGENLSGAQGNATDTDIEFPPGVNNLQIDPVELLYSSSGSFNQGFDVQYKIPQSATAQFLNKDAGNYTATVRYTLVPQ